MAIENSSYRRKKLSFTLNRVILLMFLGLYALTEIEIILNRCFGYWGLKIFKKAKQFLVPSPFFQGFQI